MSAQIQPCDDPDLAEKRRLARLQKSAWRTSNPEKSAAYEESRSVESGAHARRLAREAKAAEKAAAAPAQRQERLEREARREARQLLKTERRIRKSRKARLIAADPAAYAEEALELRRARERANYRLARLDPERSAALLEKWRGRARERSPELNAANRVRYASDPEYRKRILAGYTDRYRCDDGVFRAQERDRRKAAYDADPEKQRTAQRARYAADPAKYKAAAKARRLADPEKTRRYSREAYERDPEKIRRQSRESYARCKARREAAADDTTLPPGAKGATG